jgi:hypothetical protein
VIQFGESNHVAAARIAIAVEQLLIEIRQKAWSLIGVQGYSPIESQLYSSSMVKPIRRFGGTGSGATN